MAIKIPGSPMKLSELLTCTVRGQSGWTYGRVHDVRVQHSPDTTELVSLIIGRPGLEERLFGRGDTSEHPHRLGHGAEIPWADIVHIHGHVITIKDGTR